MTATEVCSLSLWERVGVRGYGLSWERHPLTRAFGATSPHRGEVNSPSPYHTHTSFTFFSGKLRTGLPVAAKIAFITEGVTTQMVGSPTPPQKS
jgi:hypothetical protein